MNQGDYQAFILPDSQLVVLEDTADLYPLIIWEEILVQLIRDEWVDQTKPLTGTDTPLMMIFSQEFKIGWESKYSATDVNEYTENSNGVCFEYKRSPIMLPRLFNDNISLY
jgi:hypothetical protein